jgi:hypothetical protein
LSSTHFSSKRRLSPARSHGVPTAAPAAPQVCRALRQALQVYLQLAAQLVEQLAPATTVCEERTEKLKRAAVDQNTSNSLCDIRITAFHRRKVFFVDQNTAVGVDIVPYAKALQAFIQFAAAMLPTSGIYHQNSSV